MPDRESFAGLDLAGRHLVELPAVEQGGMLWSALDPSIDLDFDSFLSGLGPELGRIGSRATCITRSVPLRGG